MPEVIFVLGTGRCGTASLTAAFKTLEGVRAFHEPRPLLIAEERLYYLARKTGKSFYLPDPAAVIREARDLLVATVIAAEEHYVEATHWLSAFIPVLLEIYPEAHIVHLIRDGREVVRSGMSGGWYRPTGAVAAWWPPPKECQDRFSRCCWRWAEINRLIAADLEKVPEGQRHSVKLEDLRDRDTDRDRHRQGFYQLCRELGLPEPAKDFRFPHVNKGERKFPAWQDWDEDLLAQAERWMGKELRRWGYLADS